MKKIKDVWVVVVDGAKARFYETNDDISALQPVGPSIAMAAASKLRSRDLKSMR